VLKSSSSDSRTRSASPASDVHACTAVPVAPWGGGSPGPGRCGALPCEGSARGRSRGPASRRNAPAPAAPPRSGRRRSRWGPGSGSRSGSSATPPAGPSRESPAR
jgi:hypothetical protein